MAVEPHTEQQLPDGGFWVSLELATGPKNLEKGLLLQKGRGTWTAPTQKGEMDSGRGQEGLKAQ